MREDSQTPFFFLKGEGFARFWGLPGFVGRRHLPGTSDLKSTSNGSWHQRSG